MLVVASLLAAIACIFFGFRSSHTAGMTLTVLILVAIPAFLVIAIKVWPHTPIGRRVILPPPSESAADADAGAGKLREMVGQCGIAQTALMPSGHVRIHNRNFNALTDQGVIEAGQAVEVVEVRQWNLVVVPSSRPVVAPRQTNPSSTNNQTAANPAAAENAQAAPSMLDRPATDFDLDSLES
jgi:hypothetical protein